MELKKSEETAQWVINNRYPKHEFGNVPDVEMYLYINEKIKEAQKNAIEVALEYAAVEADIKPDDNHNIIIVNRKSILDCKEDLFKMIDDGT